MRRYLTGLSMMLGGTAIMVYGWFGGFAETTPTWLIIDGWGLYLVLDQRNSNAHTDFYSLQEDRNGNRHVPQ